MRKTAGEQLIQEKLIKGDKLRRARARMKGRNYFIVAIKYSPILIGTTIYKSNRFECGTHKASAS